MNKTTKNKLESQFNLVPAVQFQNIELTEAQSKFLGFLNYEMIQDGENNAINIFAEDLNEMFPSSKYWAEIVQPLVNLGLVGFSEYMPKNKVYVFHKAHPRSYWLTRTYYENKRSIKLVPLKQRIQKPKLEESPNKTVDYRIKKGAKFPIDGFFYDTFGKYLKDLEFHKSITEIDPFSFDPFSYQKQKKDLINFLNGNLWCSSSSSGRFYHSVGLLPSEYRKKLLYKNRSLGEVDVKCCQLTVLYSFYERYNLDDDESIRFKRMVESEIDPYTHIWGEAWADRDIIKNKVSAYLNGAASIKGDPAHNIVVHHYFKEKFPVLADFCEFQMSKGEKADFFLGEIIYGIESDIMINEVFMNNVDKMFLIPIHDAFLIQPVNSHKVKKLVIEAFKKKIGIIPRFKVERYPKLLVRR